MLMQVSTTLSGNLHHRLWMYQTMVKSRELENRIKTIYFEGKTPVFNMAKGPIPGEMHLSVGQEPCAVGVCAHLRPRDFVTATHRPHRSEERRVGKECVRTCSSRWAPYH